MLRNNYRVLYYKPIVFCSAGDWAQDSGQARQELYHWAVQLAMTSNSKDRILKKPPPLSLQNTVQWFIHTSFRKIFRACRHKSIRWFKMKHKPGFISIAFISSIHSGPAHPHSLSLQPPQPPPCSKHAQVSRLPWALLTAVQSKLGDPFLEVTPGIPAYNALPSFLHNTTWYLCSH